MKILLMTAAILASTLSTETTTPEASSLNDLFGPYDTSVLLLAEDDHVTHRGACGDWVKEADGTRVQCGCGERPTCQDDSEGEEFCYCKADDYCEDTNCDE